MQRVQIEQHLCHQHHGQYDYQFDNHIDVVLVTKMLFLMVIVHDYVAHHGDHDDAEHGDLDDDKVSVVGWCGACVACCFSGKGLCTLFGKLPSVCKVV